MPPSLPIALPIIDFSDSQLPPDELEVYKAAYEEEWRQARIDARKKFLALYRPTRGGMA